MRRSATSDPPPQIVQMRVVVAWLPEALPGSAQGGDTAASRVARSIRASGRVAPSALWGSAPSARKQLATRSVRNHDAFGLARMVNRLAPMSELTLTVALIGSPETMFTFPPEAEFARAYGDRTKVTVRAQPHHTCLRRPQPASPADRCTKSWPTFLTCSRRLASSPRRRAARGRKRPCSPGANTSARTTERADVDQLGDVEEDELAQVAAAVASVKATAARRADARSCRTRLDSRARLR